MKSAMSVVRVVVWSFTLLGGLLSFAVMWMMLGRKDVSAVQEASAGAIGAAHMVAVYCAARTISFLSREVEAICQSRQAEQEPVILKHHPIRNHRGVHP